MNMIMYLGDITLPKYTDLKEITETNAGENVTLDGSLFVDFVNYRRGWKLSWKLLTVTDYNNIRAKFDEQFGNGTFHQFGVPAYNLNVPVYMRIDDRNIKYNGEFVEGFSIELLEQYAIS